MTNEEIKISLVSARVKMKDFAKLIPCTPAMLINYFKSDNPKHNTILFGAYCKWFLGIKDNQDDRS